MYIVSPFGETEKPYGDGVPVPLVPVFRSWEVVFPDDVGRPEPTVLRPTAEPDAADVYNWPLKIPTTRVFVTVVETCTDPEVDWNDPVRVPPDVLGLCAVPAAQYVPPSLLQTADRMLFPVYPSEFGIAVAVLSDPVKASYRTTTRSVPDVLIPVRYPVNPK
jgi:hypothetical protein